jgi:hypothetical protein
MYRLTPKSLHEGYRPGIAQPGCSSDDRRIPAQGFVEMTDEGAKASGTSYWIFVGARRMRRNGSWAEEGRSCSLLAGGEGRDVGDRGEVIQERTW